MSLVTSGQAGSSPCPAPPAAGQILHGVTLRPPVLTWHGQVYTGARLAYLDDAQARQVAGVVGIVRRQNFVGVVASQIQQARQACARLDARWLEPMPVNNAASHTVERTYQWQPAVSQPTSGQICTPARAAIASFDGETLLVWAALPHDGFWREALRAELAHLCQLAPAAIHLYDTAFHNTASATDQTYPSAIYDAVVDAALMSWHFKRTLRVEVAPCAALHAPVVDVSCRTQCHPHALVFHTEVQNAAGQPRPSLAALLCGVQALPVPDTLALCADTRNETLHACVGEAVVAAQVFARESFLDEYWRAQGSDPLQNRLQALEDETGCALIEAVRQRSNWEQELPAGRGRGFAYAHVVDNSGAGTPRHVRSAWVAEVQVQADSGQLELLRVTVGHDVDTPEQGTGPLPALAQHIHDTIYDTAARCLPTSATYDSWGNAQAAASTALANTGTDIQLARHALAADSVDHASPVLAWHRGAELPVTAAIANAIAQATGIRLRQAPLDAQALQLNARLQPGQRLSRRWKRPALWLGGVASAVGGLLLALSPWRGAIAPLAEVDTSIYSEQAIARGRLVAIAGDCMVCHTAPGGVTNAGGLALETPFGTIYSTNITPDHATGIGTWSYAAFERAMRQGIHQNGQHLYPAFPYTAFAKISDADMQALYAWLMTREPVAAQPPKTRLAFPYNLRFAMVGWNALFHDAAPYTPDPEQSRLWNRGAYLVQGAGHCGACHTPRNALGAEKTGVHFLAGGLADGWEAPALNQLSKAPIAWTESSLYEYLRTGYSPLHGVAAGPMAPVVHGLAQLPDEDVRAIAHYLAALSTPAVVDGTGQKINAGNIPGSFPQAQQAALLEQRSRELDDVRLLPGERLFDGACAVCHDTRDGPPLFGTRPSLALNTNLHSDLPDNVLQVLLHGIPEPALPALGYMPGFKDSLNDGQLIDLLIYMRQRFAPDKPAWQNLPEKIRALRAAPAGH